MKLKRLDLLAFGPFTDRTLEFSGDEYGLHIVYGPNEAGKSSALRALRQLLYGIDHKSGDGFIHPYEKMRVGALLEHSDGRVLECIRRKGRSNTLLASDGHTVLDAGGWTWKDFVRCSASITPIWFGAAGRFWPDRGISGVFCFPREPGYPI